MKISMSGDTLSQSIVDYCANKTLYCATCKLTRK